MLDTVGTALMPMTLGFLMRGDRVWLGLKKKKVAAGFLNGAGGKIDPGYTELSCLKKEIFDEWGVTIRAGTAQKMGVVDFYNEQEDGSSLDVRVHVYTISEWHGEPKESDEMGAPVPYHLNQVPYDQMMIGDRPWVQWVLFGKRVRAVVRYKTDKTLVSAVQPRVLTNKDLNLLRHTA
ncbi:MAG: hypothetical protein JWO43_281 [Candidatus Adlerbacteria bacterium]|nr:hypothetical protein [Candidatus Adlerbacteria bacterium]